MLGGLFVCGIITILFLFNDTIRTQDDIERYLEISTLGIIPIDENMSADEKKTKKRKKSSSKR